MLTAVRLTFQQDFVLMRRGGRNIFGGITMQTIKSSHSSSNLMFFIILMSLMGNIAASYVHSVVIMFIDVFFVYKQICIMLPLHLKLYHIIVFRREKTSFYFAIDTLLHSYTFCSIHVSIYPLLYIAF